MASNKAANKRQAIVDEAKADPFLWLLDHFGRATKDADRERLAFGLLPYLKPRLRSLDATVTTDIKAIIEIGGLDE